VDAEALMSLLADALEDNWEDGERVISLKE
jgi:hypothetical protein